METSRADRGRGSFPVEHDKTSGRRPEKRSFKGDVIGYDHIKVKRPDSSETENRRKEFHDITQTKPPGISKKGLSLEDQIVKLRANFFTINRSLRFNVILYHVDFSPDLEMRGIRNNLIRNLGLGGVYDGVKSIYLTHELPDELSFFKAKTRENQEVEMQIKKTRIIPFTDAQFLQVMNVILRRSMEGLNLQLVGRNLFDPRSAINAQQGIQLWPGYVTSIRQHERSMLVNVEITHKFMRQQRLIDILHECANNGRDYQASAKKAILGTTVLTDYNNNTYRIDDIDFGQNAQSKFQFKGVEISFVEYYQTKYNIKIQEPQQPLLISNAKARDIRAGKAEYIALIPELCRATGLTDDMRNNFGLMRDLSTHTRLTPRQRVDRLIAFNRRLQNPKSVDQMRQNHFEVDQQMVEFEGRIMRQETIYFGNNSEVCLQNQPQRIRDQAAWTKFIQTNVMHTAKCLMRWMVIVPHTCERSVHEFLAVFRTTGTNLGMEIAPPRLDVLNDDRIDTYVHALDTALRKDPLFIMIIVSNNNADRYSALKKRSLCGELSVPTQIIVERTLKPRKGSLMSIATNVAIQVNCKLGGIPWLVNIPLGGLLTIGVDVTHDSNDKRKSYGALVAAMNLKEDSSYFSCAFPHSNGEELSSNFGLGVCKALQAYREAYDKLPMRILIYRDGVGDGQIQYVVNQELNDIKDKINRMYASFNDGAQTYKLVFIIVNKKINTRIFTDGNENPLPGTVVDDVITMPERYDFYLVSQTVRQGTVAPTSYNIIYDTFGLPPDKMQKLTYKMCHLYYNWNGTVRVPAVVQYAHKLAFLIGQHLHQATNGSLDRTLYYL